MLHISSSQVGGGLSFLGLIPPRTPHPPREGCGGTYTRGALLGGGLYWNGLGRGGLLGWYQCLRTEFAVQVAHSLVTVLGGTLTLATSKGFSAVQMFR